MLDQPSQADLSIKPTLTGQKVILRPFTAEDVPDIWEALTDPEVTRLTGSVHSEEEARASSHDKPDAAAITWYSTRGDQTDRLDLAIVDRSSGKVVGEVVFNDVDRGNNSCSFRTLMGPAGRGRGLGSEAIRMFIEYGLKELKFHRIALEVYTFNPRARHVYEKVGFVEEGVLRDALRYDGGWVDTVVMAILGD